MTFHHCWDKSKLGALPNTDSEPLFAKDWCMIKWDIGPEGLSWFHFILMVSANPAWKTCCFLTGGTIADLIQEMKSCSKGNWPVLSEADSLGYLEDVLKAVKFIHSKGIVHRDIKGKVKTEFSLLQFFLFVNVSRRACKLVWCTCTSSQWF